MFLRNGWLLPNSIVRSLFLYESNPGNSTPRPGLPKGSLDPTVITTLVCYSTTQKSFVVRGRGDPLVDHLPPTLEWSTIAKNA